MLDIGYGSANSADDLLSRIASLKINGEGTNLADYRYLGLTTLVKSSYSEPGVNLSYIKTTGAPVGDAGDPYTGYDRFGRGEDLRCSMTSGGALRDEWLYGHDRASQISWKSNYAAAAGDDQDESSRGIGGEMDGVTKGAKPGGRCRNGIRQSQFYNYDSRADWREARQTPRGWREAFKHSFLFLQYFNRRKLIF